MKRLDEVTYQTSWGPTRAAIVLKAYEHTVTKRLERPVLDGEGKPKLDKRERPLMEGYDETETWPVYDLVVSLHPEDRKKGPAHEDCRKGHMLVMGIREGTGLSQVYP